MAHFFTWFPKIAKRRAGELSFRGRGNLKTEIPDKVNLKKQGGDSDEIEDAVWHESP